MNEQLLTVFSDVACQRLGIFTHNSSVERLLGVGENFRERIAYPERVIQRPAMARMSGRHPSSISGNQIPDSNIEGWNGAFAGLWETPC